MSPETAGQLRHLLTMFGTFVASLGWSNAAAIDSAIGAFMAAIVPIAGFIAAMVPFYLSYKAKQPSSTEAVKVAANVISNPPPAVAPVAVKPADPSAVVAEAVAAVAAKKP
jgi:hypothetical protein